MRPSFRPIWLLPRLPRTAPQNVVMHRMKTTSTKKPTSDGIPKLIILPGSANHNSLSSFLEYAKKAQLAPKSTVYVGTHYEYTTALALMRLGFSLLRVGKGGDAGIDLIGHWVLAPFQEPLPVIVQCKARTVSIDPSNVRELEGSFQGMPASWRKKGVLALLVTAAKATKGVLEALGQSRWPMGFVLVTREGIIRQFVWNRAASERGLEGVGVTVRHTPRILTTSSESEKDDESAAKKGGKHADRFENAGTEKDIQLTWMGSPIFPVRRTLDQKTVELMRGIKPGEDAEVEDGKSGALNGSSEEKTTPRKRGRPKGSKNKPKPLIEPG